MTDKLKLTLKPERYYISNNSEFKPLVKKTVTISDGTYEKSFEHSHANIKDLCNVDSDGRGLVVSFNPNKIVGHKIGAPPISHKAWQSSIYKVNETLAEYGIDCDLRESKIYRRDSDFDVVTPRPYNDYLPLWTYTLPNTASRGRNVGYENSRYLEATNTKKIAIYDKAREQELKEHVTRIEPRFLNLSNDKEFSTLLVGDVDERFYKRLRKKDKELIIKQVFTVEPTVIQAELHQYLEYCMKNKVSMSQAIKRIGLMALAAESKKYNINTVEYLKNLELNRLQRSRFLKELKNNWHVDQDMKDLFIEFKELFSKVA